MPELPEVETMRRGIQATVGHRILEVARPRCSCRPIRIEPGLPAFRRRTVTRQIVAVDRLGKRVVVRLDSGDSIVFEPRMTGLLLVADPPREKTPHLRFRLDLDGGTVRRVWYWDRRGLGSVRLLSPAQLFQTLGSDSLGPDALSLDALELRRRLDRSRREIKVALLDQKALAGIGNLYASEILHVARIHPQRRCDRLRSADWLRLHAALREVLENAILHEGSTLSDGTYLNALHQSGGYQHQHRVYDRAGETCPSCRQGTIQRFVQAQRATFYCPACQGTARRGTR
jgi:formamidopyrimidine-DNA glycosylase